MKVKQTVWARDKGRCILCQDNRAMPNAHYISRAHAGQGIETNIVTLCMRCHHEYDNGVDREYIRTKIESYLKSKYPNWKKEDQIYVKYGQMGNTPSYHQSEKR